MLTPETRNADAHQKYDTIKRGGRLNGPGKTAVAGGTVPQGNRRPAHKRSSGADGTTNIVR